MHAGEQRQNSNARQRNSQTPALQVALTRAQPASPACKSPGPASQDLAATSGTQVEGTFAPLNILWLSGAGAPKKVGALEKEL